MSGSDALIFPPLMSGLALSGPDNPMDRAVMEASRGCDAGLICYALQPDEVRAALIMAPEVPLRHAIAMLPACGVGLQNALGALAPPEVAVHLEWDGGIRINGARAGRFDVKASDIDPGAIPDWLVIGWHLRLWPSSQDAGDTPHETALYAEGCADITAPQLVESWARHSLAWITKWEDTGAIAVHEAWRGLLHGLGEAHTHDGHHGIFMGLDEDFGLLLRQDTETRLFPMTGLIEP